MHRNATVLWSAKQLAVFAVIACAAASLTFAQAIPANSARTLDWRHIGNAAVALNLADLATGPVDRAWYADGGNQLWIRTGLGQVFATMDFESWVAAPANTVVPPVAPDSAPVLPEEGAQIRRPYGATPRVYAFGRFVYRSDDGGKHWENTTSFHGASIIGDGLRDMTVSPGEEDEITVADGVGVFRSMDGGRTWHGLNVGLPNLPGAKLRAVPSGGNGTQIELPSGLVVEWQPGERQAWRPGKNDDASFESALRARLTEYFGTPITAAANRGSYVYAGTSTGRISVSADGSMRSWVNSQITSAGPVQAFWVDAADARIALAVFGSTVSGAQGTRIIRTFNGGISWDDMTSNLSGNSVRGITVDRSDRGATSNAVYVATDQGAYWARFSINTLGAQPQWALVAGLPAGRVFDVRLDTEAVQLSVDLEGLGIYQALAPHRFDDPKVVSAADLIARAAAPGALLSIAGARVSSVTAGSGGQFGNVAVPVLDAAGSASQIQVPFNVTGSSLALTAQSSGGPQTLQFPAMILRATSPAISMDSDGTPLLLDADRGTLLDSSNPIRSRMRVQILATGLGRVTPDWPAGTPGPAENAPRVVAAVTAYLDSEPLEVKRAIYAPGNIGMYLVEVEIPTLIYQGMAELHIEAGGQSSNAVHVLVVRDSR